MRRILLPLLVVLAVGCGGSPESAPKTALLAAGKVDLTPVTVAELDQAIAAHKGKVVVIDAWFLG